nr:pyridoxal-phosphate dependent enzyme [Streptomyces olivoverticillatus]
MADVEDGRAHPAGPGGARGPSTPVVTLEMSVGGHRTTLRLKLEAHGPYGSVKGRTALALWEDVADRVNPAIGIVESTSGNLGLALAAVAAARRVPFTAVVDPVISTSLADAVRVLGGRLITVDEPDGAGGYLLSRLARLRELLRAEPGLVWPDQYTNPASPLVHVRETGPELRAQIGEQPADVLIAVSTGGTLAGFRRYAAAARPPWRLVGVDVGGSAALGGRPGRRVLPGIGASRPSAFLPDGHRPTVRVTPDEAVSACLWLAKSTGIEVGGSSGALVAAALRLQRHPYRQAHTVCLCPDGADRYLDTVYDASWRAGKGLTEVDVARDAEILSVERAA